MEAIRGAYLLDGLTMYRTAVDLRTLIVLGRICSVKFCIITLNILSERRTVV